MKKRLGCLLTVLAGCCFITACYLFCLDPNRGYYRAQFGLVSAKPFRIHGKVIDQYGQPVEGFKMELATFFEEHPASVAHTKAGPFYALTDKAGLFYFDTTPTKLNGVFVESAKGPISVGNSYYHNSAESGWDIFTLYKGRWIRDGRWENHGTPINVPHDESKEYIYHVGHSGPPEPQIRFQEMIRTKAVDDYWFGVNILTGKLEEGGKNGCEIVVHAVDFASYCLSEKDCPEVRPFRVDIRGEGDCTVQLTKDSFLCEAPPEGYSKEVHIEPYYDGTRWQIGAPGQHTGAQAWDIYYKGYDDQVFGYLRIEVSGGGSHPRYPKESREWMICQVKCIANPRGQRNLDYGLWSASPCPAIPLPITLPWQGFGSSAAQKR